MTIQLQGLRALILEDEALIAMDIEDTLEKLGLEIMGWHRTVEGALAQIDEVAPDLALLDINLGNGVTSLPVAQYLKNCRVPFAFLTGYGRSALLGDFPDVDVLSKPLDEARLIEVLRRLAVQSHSVPSSGAET
jgi:AmiR/NasT family two-component response regulator